MKEKVPVPEYWETVFLESICNILDSQRIPVNLSERNKRIKGKKQDQLYPYYGATGQVGWIDDYIFDGEFVLVGEDGAPFLDPFKEKAYIASGKFWVNNHAHILQAFTSNKYVKYFLDQVAFDQYVTGTTRLKLNQSNLRKIKLLFPPENEQRLIVAKIEQLFSELDKGMAELKKARKTLELYRQSLLKAAFEGKLTEKWRKEHAGELESADQLLARIKADREKRYQHQLKEWKLAIKQWEAQGKQGHKPAKPHKPKELPPLIKEKLAKLPKLPEVWRWVYLNDIAEIVGGVTKGRKLEGKETIKVPYLRVANVQDGYLDLDIIKQMSVLQEDLEKYLLISGDILYTEGGDKDKLGRGAIWLGQIENCIHQNHIFRARVIKRFIDPQYVSFYSQTRIAKKYFFRHAKQTTNLASINLTVLSSLYLPLISINEQRQVVATLERYLPFIDHLKQTINNTLDQADLLRQSILEKAFSGKLVPQVPSDEPASELLKRIKVEREKAAEEVKPAPKISKKREKRQVADLLTTLSQAGDWIAAQEAFRQCGISDGAETDQIEMLYIELRDLKNAGTVEVERRGEEDWLKVKVTQEA